MSDIFVSKAALPEGTAFMVGAPIRMEIRPSADGRSYDVTYVWRADQLVKLVNLPSEGDGRK